MKLINPLFSLVVVPFILADKEIKLKLKGGTDDNCFDKIGNFISCKAGAALNTFIYDNKGFICLKADEQKPYHESRCITKSKDLTSLSTESIRLKFKYSDGKLESNRMCIASNGEKLVKVGKKQCVFENQTGLDWIRGQFRVGAKCLVAVWNEDKGNYIAKFKNCDSRFNDESFWNKIDARGQIEHVIYPYLCLTLNNDVVDMAHCKDTPTDKSWSYNETTKSLKYDDKCIVKRKQRLVAIDCLKPIEILE